MKRSAIIIAASSDIGNALCEEWHNKGWKIAGTYRTSSEAVSLLQAKGIDLFPCDLLKEDSILSAVQSLLKSSSDWDTLIFAPGVMDPIGTFDKIDFSLWEQGIQTNFLKPLQILHLLLPYRNKISNPTVLFFAGGGVNNSVIAYSSYTISKIALIKMCELLDHEVPDTRFVIVGPGWVKTKIHQSTLEAKDLAETNLQRTIDKFQKNDWVSMKEVVDCCTYFVTTPCNAISGRNFSTAFDFWGSSELETQLAQNKEMYKLRRHGNEWGKN